MNARTFLVGFVLLMSPLRAIAAAAPNAVTDWAAIVQQAIHNPPAAPRSAGTSEILHAMVMLAVYDAAVAVEGGFRPYVGRDPSIAVRRRACGGSHRGVSHRPRPHRVLAGRLPGPAVRHVPCGHRRGPRQGRRHPRR